MDTGIDSNKVSGEVIIPPSSPGEKPPVVKPPSPEPIQPKAGAEVPPWISGGQPEAGQPAGAEPGAEGEGIPPRMVKKSPFAKIVPLLLIGLLGVGAFFLITRVVMPLFQKTKNGEKAPSAKSGSITLTYWGLWESKEVIQPLIEEYKKNHPEVTINYLQQSHKDYRERLQSALARNEGPDIFRFHNTWVPMLKKELASMPAEVSGEINFETDFYPVAVQDLKVGSQYFGIPLEFDALALFYNAQMLKEAGKTFPTTWDELRRTAADLTVYDDQGQIQSAGVALGVAGNVDHFSEILGLMMLQNGVDLSSPVGVLAEDALKFYTLFYTTDKVWNESLPSSVYAFATAKVAMIFAPSWRAHEIKQINPELEFKTAAVPQLPGTQVGWATYWVEGVSNRSQNQEAAWDFLTYLVSKEVLARLYSQSSNERDFGEPYSRKDLASQLEDDPVVGAFVQQGPYAQSWYLCARTHDNGLNDKMIKYFEDAVNAVIKGESASSALTNASQGVTQVLSQYGMQ